MVAPNEKTARAVRIALIREEINAGVYESPHKLKVAVARLTAVVVGNNSTGAPDRHGNCSSEI